MDETARDLYLLVAVFGLVPAVRLAGMPVLASSAFAAVGGVGALQLERAGLPIGGAVLIAVVLGGVAGALTGGVGGRGEPAVVAPPTGGPAGAGGGGVLGVPSPSGGGPGAARAEPAFVALTTWALAWLAYVVLLGFPSLSGGGQGLTRPALDTVETPIGVSLTLTPPVHVIAAAVLCALAYAASAWFARSPAG